MIPYNLGSIIPYNPLMSINMDVVFFSSGAAAEVYEKRPGNDSDDIDISKDRGLERFESASWVNHEWGENIWYLHMYRLMQMSNLTNLTVLR